MAACYTLYRADMGSDHEAEIRASVGAHDDLGPGYDDAVAEGLVERIGDGDRQAGRGAAEALRRAVRPVFRPAWPAAARCSGGC